MRLFTALAMPILLMAVIFGVTSAQVCCDFTGCHDVAVDGGGGTSGSGGPVVYKDGSEQRGYYDGDYWTEQTIVGHVNENGQKRMFDADYMENWLTEYCLPLQETDWHGFGDALVSPTTTYGTGGYATGPFDCLFGQALMWSNHWEWHNAANPTENDSRDAVYCEVVKTTHEQVC